MKGNRVTKVVTKSGKVKGVEFYASVNTTTSFVGVSREVILSASDLHTPQLLLLSGIGAKAHLSSLGIETVVDLPGVGANYHVHLLLYTGQTGKSISMLDGTNLLFTFQQ